MNIVNNKKALDLIYNSIMSEGGDGDAIWLSKYTTLSDLETEILLYDKKNNTEWKLIKHDNYFEWGNDQEWAIITDNKVLFDATVSTLKLNY